MSAEVLIHVIWYSPMALIAAISIKCIKKW
jgi:hypothetical protein